MTVKKLVDLIYKRKKDGQLSFHANRFLEKHNLNIDRDLTKEETMFILITINSQDKRELVLKELLSEVEEKQDLNLREVTYKEACKYYHPDNLDTGSSNIFKFIQDIKEYIWEWDGKPVEDIYKRNWKEAERYNKLSPQEAMRDFAESMMRKV